jgi:hypothetical protein
MSTAQYRQADREKSSPSGIEYSCTFRVLSDHLLARKDLNGSDKILLMVLSRFGRGKPHCTVSVGRLAAEAGVSRKTVTRGLGRLDKLSLIRDVPDRGNVTRRRIYKLWMDDPTIHPCKVQATGSPGQKVSTPGQDAPAVGTISPTREPLGEQVQRTAAAPGPQPDSSSSSRGEGEGKAPEADPAELARVAARVGEVYGGDAEANTPRVAHLARKYPLAWIRRAIEDVARVAAKEEIGWPLLPHILGTYRAEGGPPPPRKAKPKPPEPEYFRCTPEEEAHWKAMYERDRQKAAERRSSATVRPEIHYHRAPPKPKRPESSPPCTSADAVAEALARLDPPRSEEPPPEAP